MTSTTRKVPDSTVLRHRATDNVTLHGTQFAPAEGERFRLVRAQYGLQKFTGQAPYFTVTGEAWYQRPGRRAADPDTCGCIHDIVSAAFPDLADLIALHLCDVTGAPMHAESNGWYWYSDYDGKGAHQVHGPWALLTPIQRAEDYLRCPGLLRPGMDRQTFAAHVEALRPQWLTEATAAIDKHNLSDREQS